MAKSFNVDERKILSILSEGTPFNYKGKKYTIITSGKPTCPSGEPKTDVYILAKSDNNSYEFKISYKKGNADFIENKMNAERAELLFGTNWERIIADSTYSVFSAFEARPLIYKKNYKHTEKGSFTLGWKFELLNKLNGELSGKMHLNKQQVIDVYAGTNIPEEKQNAFVNGKIIESSGIANFILLGDNYNNADEIFKNITPIELYVDEHPEVYFACKALNYRSNRADHEKKWDGDRPLSVFVNWSACNGKLVSELVFDSPLSIKGDLVGKKLMYALNQLGIHNDNDISHQNVLDYSTVIE